MPDIAENFSNMQPFRYLYRMDKFKFGMCALDVRRNYLHTKEDGIVNYFEIDGEHEEGVKELCISFLNLAPLERAGMFAICQNGEVFIFIHNENLGDDAEFYRLIPKIGVNKDFYTLGELALAERLDCYGLIVEVKQGIFMIVEH